MKHITYALLAFAYFYSSAAAAADGDNYIPLNQIMVEDHNDETDRPARSIKDLYNDGVRTTNQVLDCSNRKLTTCSDLPNYAKTFGLATLVTMNVSNNDIAHEDVYTILKHTPKLTCLIASRNKRITSVKNMPAHDTLETLLLNDCSIAELNVAHLCTQLLSLRQLALQNNPVAHADKAITNITGIYPQMEEFWLGDSEGLYPAQWDAFIKAFPNIKAELCAGSRTVQKYYSKAEQNFDNCNECECTTDEHFRTGMWAYCGAPLIGGIAGLISASITIAVTQAPLGTSNTDSRYWSNEQKTINQQNFDLFGIYCAIMIPIGAIVPPLMYRVGKSIKNYCCTAPHDRYKTVHTRDISARPQLLDLVADVVEPDPGQEE